MGARDLTLEVVLTNTHDTDSSESAHAVEAARRDDAQERQASSGEIERAAPGSEAGATRFKELRHARGKAEGGTDP